MSDLKVPAARSSAPTTDLAASLNGVSVAFTSPTGEKSQVLRGIDLEIRDGEFVVLVGKSGCGKTTILNLLAGLVQPTEGTVEVLGRGPQEAREEMGYMFARDALIPWRTSRRNVEYPLELAKTPRSGRKAAAQKYLEMVHMGHAASQWPWQLSQGMRQRVALARTWVREPRLLLMDEPFAALDAQTRLAVQQELVGMWQGTNKAIVFVTHDLSEALMLGQRVIFVQEGEIAVDAQIPFDYPRTRETNTSHEFQELRRQLMTHFE